MSKRPLRKGVCHASGWQLPVCGCRFRHHVPGRLDAQPWCRMDARDGTGEMNNGLREYCVEHHTAMVPLACFGRPRSDRSDSALRRDAVNPERWLLLPTILNRTCNPTGAPNSACLHLPSCYSIGPKIQVILHPIHHFSCPRSGGPAWRLAGTGRGGRPASGPSTRG